jgi:hypothetical protein
LCYHSATQLTPTFSNGYMSWALFKPNGFLLLAAC